MPDRRPERLLVGALAFAATYLTADLSQPGIGTRGTVTPLVRRELAFNAAPRAVGSAVAVLALLGLFGQYYRDAAADKLAPSVVALLAGLTLATQSWPAPAALAIVVAASVVRRNDLR